MCKLTKTLMIANEAAVKLTHNEVIKAAIPTLAGNIAATLGAGTDQFSADDQQFTKFHGIYQQDDRDLRKTQKKYITPPGMRPRIIMMYFFCVLQMRRQ